MAELLRSFFYDGYEWLHHGDCIGADEFAHGCWRLGTDGKVWLHPPSDPRKRAFCGADREEKPVPYLARNDNIVASVRVLLAAPNSMTENLRSGTWATIRYARKKGIPIYIVLPNGAMYVEGQAIRCG
jgi:hypothetical protein